MENTLLSNSINELEQISNDIKHYSNISNLHYRVDNLFFSKIKIINEHLSTLQTAIDINWKIGAIPSDVLKLRRNLISLIDSTRNLNVNVISKNDSLINQYNELIIETLADMDNIPTNAFK